MGRNIPINGEIETAMVKLVGLHCAINFRKIGDISGKLQTFIFIHRHPSGNDADAIVHWHSFVIPYQQIKIKKNRLREGRKKTEPSTLNLT